MNRIEAKRMLKLAAFLRALRPKLFDYQSYLHLGDKDPAEALKAGGGCGTTCCAAGWTPAVFPSLVRWGNKRGDNPEYGDVVLRADESVIDGEVTMPIFGLTSQETYFLFYPDTFGSYKPDSDEVRSPPENATAKQVASHLERFVYTRFPDLKVA